LVLPVHRLRDVVLGGVDLRAAAVAAHTDEARIARLARGGVPLQQPAARRVLSDDPLGCRLPVAHRGSARRDAVGLEAVLQLLPAQLRFAAPLADGDRT